MSQFLLPAAGDSLVLVVIAAGVLGRHLDDELHAAGMVRGDPGLGRRLHHVLVAPPRSRPQEPAAGHRGEPRKFKCGTTSSAKRLPKSSNAMYLNYK